MNKITTKDVMNMVQGVKDFNTIMGNDLTNKELTQTYFDLTKEEFSGDKEFYMSYLDEDKEGTLDGLIDLVFTSFAWYLLGGYKFKEGYIDQLIKESNMTTLKTDVYDLKDLISQGLSYYTVNTLIRILTKDEVTSQFDIMGGFKNILDSNMSKVILDGELNIEDELKLIESKGRYKDITVQEVVNGGNVYLAFKAGEDTENNVKFKAPKIIKTSLFKEPELSDFIY